MVRVIRRYELSDDEWERQLPYFRERQEGDKDVRSARDAERYLLGCPQRGSLARPSGALWPLADAYKRFREWSDSGLIEKDLQDISIDSTYIKAHKASAGTDREGAENPQIAEV